MLAKGVPGIHHSKPVRWFWVMNKLESNLILIDISLLVYGLRPSSHDNKNHSRSEYMWDYKQHMSAYHQQSFCALSTSPVWYTVYPKKYAHGFVVLCFVVVMQSFIMNSHEVFIHIHQGCFAGTGAIVRLPQCQWSKPDGYVKISHCITTTKHSKAKTVCIFLGIYCIWHLSIAA